MATRTLTDAVVVDALLAVRGMPEGLYGRRKMAAHLCRQGLHIAHCTVDRVMRDLGMNGLRRSKEVRTTIVGRHGKRAGDLLERGFTAEAPNTRWVAGRGPHQAYRVAWACSAHRVDLVGRDAAQRKRLPPPDSRPA